MPRGASCSTDARRSRFVPRNTRRPWASCAPSVADGRRDRERRENHRGTDTRHGAGVRRARDPGARMKEKRMKPCTPAALEREGLYDVLLIGAVIVILMAVTAAV